MADGGMTPTEPKVDSERPGARLDLRDIARSPASRQLMLLVGVALAVAMGVAVVLWSRGPNFGMLYAGLDQKDAAAITQALQASNTPYTLAGQGLPQGSANSAALPAADSPFGMSDMAERTRYQQMLETDLGNTIGALQSVRSARVHLALPKPSAFIRDNRQASASVLVTLFPGRQLDASQVAAIVHLVSSSVPELDAKQVSVVDQQGQLLTGDAPDSAAAVGDTRLRLATRIENTYAQRIEELLTPLVGAGKVRAQVYADLDFSQTEKATETYDHEHPALRSEQTSSEQRVDGAASGAVPGALSNQPPNTVAQPTAANPQAGAAANGAANGAAGANAASTTTVTPSDTSSSATRNYELDRTISHVSDPAGRLSRISVAVVVDNKLVGSGKDAKSVPFTQQELDHLTELAKNAVGFNAARGDSVSVVNQPFHRDTVSDDGSLPATPFWQRPGMLDLIKQGGGILVALIVAFGLLRPLLKGLSRGPARASAPVANALPSPMPKVSVRVDDIPEDEPARIGQAIAYEQKINMARRLVSENPKQVAQVVRNWVGDNG
jgi:flagellar M-ring protein FliF